VRGHLRPFHIASVVVVVAAVAPLTGCGGKSGTTTAAGSTTTTSVKTQAVGKATYDRMMQQLGRKVSRSIESMYPLLDEGVGTPANKEAAAKVEKARVTVGQAATSLAGVIPPAPIRADHRRLLLSLGKLQLELAKLEHVLQQGGPKPFGDYTQFVALQTIRTVTDDMTKKGFSVD